MYPGTKRSLTSGLCCNGESQKEARCTAVQRKLARTQPSGITISSLPSEAGSGKLPSSIKSEGS
jgi:hypothetical protein